MNAGKHALGGPRPPKGSATGMEPICFILQAHERGPSAVHLEPNRCTLRAHEWSPSAALLRPTVWDSNEIKPMVVLGALEQGVPR